MKGNRFSHREGGSGPIARERLKLMEESAPFEHSPAAARRMKKEISDIISRYFEFSPDDYELRVVLKQNRKRA